MFCEKCGNKLDPEANFCNKCGKQVSSISDTEPVRTKVQSKQSGPEQPKRKPKEFRFGKNYLIVIAILFVLMTILFVVIGADTLSGSALGSLILAVPLGIVLTYFVKWSRRGFKYEEERSLSKEDTAKYKGIAGWLFFVILGLFVVLAMQGYAIYEGSMLINELSFLGDPSSKLYIGGYMGILKVEFVIDILLFLFAGYLIYLFFKKNRRFPKLYIAFLVIAFVYLLFDFFAVFLLDVPTEMAKEIDELLEETGTEVIKQGLSSIIWGLYMVKSKRVKATFVED